jgi:hypothetical protein
MKYGYEELHGSREKWFDSVKEAKEWAEKKRPIFNLGWDGRSGLKSKEASV